MEEQTAEKDGIAIGKEKSIIPFLKGPVFIKRVKKGETMPNGEEVKEPVAFIIKDNFDVEILDDVPEGTITIRRRTGDKEEEVKIINPKSKLLSFPFINGQKRGWIIDEKEAVALPTRTKMDSLELKRIINALVLNYKTYEEGVSKNWWFWVIIGIVVIFLISAIFGVNIQEMIFGKTQQEVTQTSGEIIKATIDTNKETLQEMSKEIGRILLKGETPWKI